MTQAKDLTRWFRVLGRVRAGTRGQGGDEPHHHERGHVARRDPGEDVRHAARQSHGRLAKPVEAVNQSAAVKEPTALGHRRGHRAADAQDGQVVLGGVAPTPEQANAMVARGYRALVVGFDWSLLQRGCAAAIECVSR